MRIGLILLLWMLLASGIGASIWYLSSASLKRKRKELTKAELVRQEHQSWNLEFTWAGGNLEELPPRNGEVWDPAAPMPQLQAYDRWSISGKDRETLHALMDACPSCSVLDVHNWTMCPECAKNPGIIAIVRRGIHKTG